jgi:hypothetical protein
MVPVCPFEAGAYPNDHSPCLGYGMVDATKAVKAAQACGEYTFLSDIIQDNVESGYPPSGVLFMPPTSLLTRGIQREVDEPLGFFAALSPDCPCLKDGTSNPDFGGPPFELTMMVYSPGSDVEINEDILRHLECLSSGKCACLTDPDCIRLNLINENADIWHDVTFQVCVSDHCWDLPPRIPVWEPGEKLTVPMVVDEMIPAMWRATGVLPTLKAYSQGEEIPLLN